MAKLPFLERSAQTIQKMEYVSNLDWGCRPEDRSTEQMLRLSFVNVNKPKGPTSHTIADYAKKIAGAKKAGHGGTLDPAVTGVLPVALDDATKVIKTMLAAGKEYICYMHVHDATISRQQIEQVLKAFVGNIEQLPPKKSAVKRQWRKRNVYYLDILEIAGPDVLFRVGTQAGTYIRKLCTDIGAELGCGAHMQQLVRTQSGTFPYDEAITLQDFNDAMEYYKQGDDKFLRKILVPVERVVQHIPKIVITDGAIASITHGAALAIPGIVALDDDIKKDKTCCLFSQKGELVALATAKLSAPTIIRQDKGIAAALERVIMSSKTYAAAKQQN